MTRASLLVLAAAGSLSCGGASPWTELDSIDDLKGVFQRDAGKARIVLLLSPTCGACVSGARRVQKEILDARPDAEVRVYAIYFEMVEDDRGAKTRVNPKELLDDPRVTSFWDDRKIAGRWFDENVTKLGERQGDPNRIEWDSFILYGREAQWGESPPDHVSWGRPLVHEAGRLEADLEGILPRS